MSQEHVRVLPQAINGDSQAHPHPLQNSPQPHNLLKLNSLPGRLRGKRRQPIGKTLREMLMRAWMRAMVACSTVAPFCLRLAALPLGPYKDKRELLRYMGNRPYISPLAQVSCPRLHLSRHCFIDDYVTIYAHPRAEGEVRLAENVHLYRWSTIELGAGSGSLTIGANTYLQAGCTLNPFLSSITIGQNCMIAPRCTFMPYQHSFADTSRPMREQPLTSRGDIVLEDDVWLGAHVCVMDGVTIGQGAIVGAGAVVTKDVPPHAVAAGVPARVIHTRTDARTSDVRATQGEIHE